MTTAFIDRWTARFDTVYEEAELKDVPWFTAAPGIKLMEAITSGLIRRGDKVADFGCGPGSDAVFLASAGAVVTAVDISPAALTKAKEFAEWAGVSVDFRHASILDTGLDGDSMDVVTDSFVFHNVSDEAQQGYAAEVHRVLRPDGRFLLNSFSDQMVDGSGPRRITSEQIFRTFTADRFVCEHLEIYRNLPTAARPDQLHWFGVFRAIKASAAL
jgi:ubiquinone/menaquinone biosynthesis C-methylase UbiE